MRQSLGLIALILFVAGLSFVLSAQNQQGGRTFTVTLTGAAEVPGPGDPDGAGTAKITLNSAKNEVCYELMVDNIAPANAAHIHLGAADKAGPPVLTLTSPENGSSRDCAPLDHDKIMDVVNNPSGYYVNIHNAEYPKGALRGQLAK